MRELTPQVLGAVVRRFRDFAAAEDAVQEASLAAAMQWPRDGLPDNPRAWLTQAAFRRMADHIRSESARRRREGELALEEGSLLRRIDGYRDGASGRRHARPSLHVLPSGVESSFGDRADVAGSGRLDHSGDRPRVSGARTHNGPANQPGQAKYQEFGHSLPTANVRGASAAPARGSTRPIPHMQ
jgi:Sigma-70 region 2